MMFLAKWLADGVTVETISDKATNVSLPNQFQTSSLEHSGSASGFLITWGKAARVRNHDGTKIHSSAYFPYLKNKKKKPMR
jgi:hypothetical protein